MSCSSNSCGCDCTCPQAFSLDRSFAINGVTTGEDFEVPSQGIDQIHVILPEDEQPGTVAITLPQSPRIGQQVLVAAGQGATVTVTGGNCWDICGGDVTVSACSSRSFTFTKCSWIASAQSVPT